MGVSGLRAAVRLSARRLVGEHWPALKLLAYHPRVVRSRLNPLRRGGLRIMSIDRSIDALLDGRRSLARFGDGELSILMGIDGPRFQTIDPTLTRRLRDVIESRDPELLIGMPGALVDSAELIDTERFFWGDLARRDGRGILRHVPTDREYVDSLVTRVYTPHEDAEVARNRFARLQELWRDRDILFVEGEFTRSGVGNDLFDAARSIARIVCPPQDAFTHYDEILAALIEHGRDRLVICSLGPTATVLALDASRAGIQCVDLGHLDLEYMWALQGRGKVLVPSRHVSELTASDDLELAHEATGAYETQVVRRIPAP